jgi:hypothetical protein
MLRNLLRLGLAATLVLASLVVAGAQERRKSIDDYRQLFRKPETVIEFWKALQFEIEVGRTDLAAQHLHGLLALRPTDAQLLELVDEVGLTSILRLRTIRVWSKNPKEQKQAEADVKSLLGRASAAARARLNDPKRIGGLIRQLKESPEDRAYAIRELYRTGTPAMPYLIDALSKARSADDRWAILQALQRMGPEAIAPLIAALDSDDVRLKLDVLDLLRRHVRSAAQITPHLWFPSANKDESPQVRKKATALLADFLDLPASRLQPARTALTREAEKYYRHEARFGDPKAVVIWRWNGKGVMMGWPGVSTVSASQAEEYWGLRFARQALTLDPTYKPAQVVFLSLAIDKAKTRGGVGIPLSRSAPEVAQLVAKASPELLIEILDRALKEQRTGVILATTRALGDRAEVRAKKPTGRGNPPLVQALYYPDQRVQLSAAESLLLIPGPPAPKTASRIVEVLGRLLSPAVASRTGRKVILAIFDENWRTRTRTAAEDAGVDPVAVSNGRDLMREVRARGDVDAILLESTLPQPGLAQLLAQLRADVDVGKVPVLLAAVPQTRASHDIARRVQRIDRRLATINAETRSYRAALRAINEEEANALKDIAKTKFATKDERVTAETITRDKFAEERRRLDQDFLSAVRLAKDAPKLEAEKDRLAARYDRQSQVREEQLERFTTRYQNIRVVHTSVFTDAKTLETVMTAAIRQAGVALSPEERTRYAEIAIQILSKLAMGQPRGYDVKPVANIITEALRTGRLSERGQIAAIDAIARLPGPRSQVELAHTILDKARTGEARKAAVEALVLNVQQFGVQLSDAQMAPLRALAREDKLPPGLKGNLDVLIGALRPDARTTGERLKGYKFTPVAPLPPPKK